jgi:hypothetical protein
MRPPPTPTQVALLTGRQVAWPSLPCAGSEWIDPNPAARRLLPLPLNLRFLAHWPTPGERHVLFSALICIRAFLER